MCWLEAILGSKRSETGLRRRFTTRYMLALACIAATILLGATQLHSILAINEKQGDIINVAGAQRMLSQRIALLAPRVVEEQDPLQRERAYDDLKQAIERMEYGLNRLTTSVMFKDAPAIMSRELVEHYWSDETGVVVQVRAFLLAFKGLVSTAREMPNDVDRFRILAETTLLADLDEAVNLHAKAARDSMAAAIQVHGIWVVISLVLLMLEVIVVFRPMARSSAKTLSKMSADLENRTTTLSRSMKIGQMGHWIATDEKSDKIWLSRELASLYGLEVQEGSIPLSMLRQCDVHDPEQPDTNKVHVACKRAWKTGEPTVGYGRFRRPDKEVIDIVVDITPQKNASGKVVAVEGVVRDVTKEAESARQLRQSVQTIEKQKRDLVQAQRMGKTATWRRQIDSDFFNWNERTFQLLRLDPKTFVPTVSNVRRLYVGDGYSDINKARKSVLAGVVEQAVEVQMKVGDGSILDIRVLLTVENDETGKPEAFFGTLQDITAEKDAARELEQLAYFDGLTGLANRTLFTRQLQTACQSAVTTGHQAALLLLDLDHFKEVNDGLGHAAGDELLALVAQRLKKCVSASDLVSRLGGDEFAVIVPNYTDQNALDALCAHIIDSIGKPASLSGGEVQVFASIGVAKVPVDSTKPNELMRYADLALYSSKEAGRGRTHNFTESMNAEIGERLQLANHIRKALDENLFEAHFQPIVCMKTNKVSSFEALLRLPHPEKGYISPAAFIPIAESSHLIAELGSFVLHAACQEASDWRKSGLPTRQVAVNVSAAQLWHGDLEMIIDSALDKADLPPECLCIELTESVFALDSLGRLKGILQRLKERGITIALDDFGTGYSSLSYLSQLPFDKLKIDRAFVAGTDVCENKRKMLQGIISLGHGLGMPVVAEGVETETELDVIRDLGGEFVQGWYYGKARLPQQAIIEAANIESQAQLRTVRQTSVNLHVDQGQLNKDQASKDQASKDQVSKDQVSKDNDNAQNVA